MTCRRCQSFINTIAQLQQNVASLNQRIFQLQKINDTLIKTFKNCDVNQDWKTKCELLNFRNYQLEKQLKLIAKNDKITLFPINQYKDSQNTSPQDQLSSLTCLRQRKTRNNLQKQVYQNKFHQNLLFQTPRRPKRNSNSQKMQIFIKSLKKNKTSLNKKSSSKQYRFMNQQSQTQKGKLYKKSNPYNKFQVEYGKIQMKIDNNNASPYNKRINSQLNANNRKQYQSNQKQYKLNQDIKDYLFFKTPQQQILNYKRPKNMIHIIAFQ